MNIFLKAPRTKLHSTLQRLQETNVTQSQQQGPSSRPYEQFFSQTHQQHLQRCCYNETRTNVIKGTIISQEAQEMDVKQDDFTSTSMDILNEFTVKPKPNNFFPASQVDK